MVRKTLLLIIVVGLVLLASLSGFILLHYIQGGSPGSNDYCQILIGLTYAKTLNQSTGNFSWILTIVTIKEECIPTTREDLIVEIWIPGGSVALSATVKEISDGATPLFYHDVTPPSTTLDRHDYFEIPTSEFPAGSLFGIKQKSDMSWIFYTELK